MSKKKPPPSKRSSLTSLGGSTSTLNHTRAGGIFTKALEGETFGNHPGYVDLKIRISIYNPMTQVEERLPDKGIEMLVSSIDEVDQMLEIMTRALKDWAVGMSPYQ